MKLSTKARYGLKAMCLLAEKNSEVISLAQIALETEISEAYLEQLFSILRKNNLVIATRGAGGGYQIVDSPQNITVGQVIRALEDDLEFVDCISGDCDNKCNCATHGVWKILYTAINDALDGITLEKVIRGEQ